MIMGNTCTRNCHFCGINNDKPLPLDPDEPNRIAAAVKKLGLEYVVITSVTRDDLKDGGASHFANVINTLQASNTNLRIEVLIPDFQGSELALNTVLEAKPFVLNHNIETISRLYSQIRPQANYQQSLDLLKRAKKSPLYTKSGFMVGLGESKDEVFAVLNDLFAVGCDIVTIGQYLPPSNAHPKVARYVTPEEFEEYKKFGMNLGFYKVFSGPFVRSSYHAKEIISE